MAATEPRRAWRHARTRLARAPFTVRGKLALIYTGVFLVGGVLLLALNYSIVSASLAERGVELAKTTTVSGPVDGSSETVSGEPFSRTDPGPGLRARAIPTEVIEDYQTGVLSDLLLRSGLGLAAVTLLAALAGWIIAGRPLRRLHQVTETARRLSERDLGSRLALEGPPDEFKELGDTFDGMLQRLQAAFEAQRRFVANASHELRTPLAVQRAAAEVPLAQGRVPEELRPALDRVVESTARSERLIAGLLLLARSDQGIAEPEPVDLADAARHAVRSCTEDAAAAGVTLRSDLGPAVVSGDRLLLEQLVGNLVDNAVRYNRPGGEVTIAAGVRGGDAVLRVRNTGQAVAEAERLFEPFHRGGDARLHRAKAGTGLGLSIARSIATAHSGRITAAAREGGGLSVTLRLPPHTAAEPATGTP
ncbi:signal transduction histidine kinase [Murinocardiopsis flavida]|uniref:histidine kinase n=1 Tax=Murinocardiopsis flavida TaxID=645275 RepID=A0A2P8CZ92_9ACTN|nr:HAMP domain-containing sensor histidine kinase [Murinocardiopsis flavida]PSK90246.1 signal transduction histidine kinase [Murinocardiopsis flavida]